MKKSIIVLTAVAIATIGGSALADTYVEGHFTQNGTWVEGHYRSDPNGDKSDNWSTQGNVNPYTGKVGTRKYDEW